MEVESAKLRRANACRDMAPRPVPRWLRMSLRIALLVGVVALPALALKDPTFEALIKYRSFRWAEGMQVNYPAIQLLLPSRTGRTCNRTAASGLCAAATAKMASASRLMFLQAAASASVQAALAKLLHS